MSFGSALITDLSDLSVTANHLDENIPYFFRVSAINAAGRGAGTMSTPQFAVSTPQSPTAPSNVTLEAVDGTSVAVTLYSPLSDGGKPLDSFRVEWGTSPIVDEVQQVRLQVPIVQEIQQVSSSTSTVGEVQLVLLTSTYNAVPANEVQQVSCDALSTGTGFFSLNFLGETTARIAVTETSVSAIEAVLEELTSIVDVQVSFFGGQTTACEPCPSTGCTSGFEVTFVSVNGVAGDMPKLTGNTNDLESVRRIDVTQSVQGQSPVSGTFRLTYLRGRDADTVPLQYNAPAATVEAALAALDASVTVSVSDGTSSLPAAEQTAGARLWRVTFVNSGRIPDMLVRPTNNLLVGNGAGIQIFTKGATYGGIPASVAGNSVTGTFRLRLGGHVTDPIDFDASDTTVKARLEALPNIGTVAVTRTGPSLKSEYSWSVTFTSNPESFPIGSGNLDALTADSTSLLGSGSTVTISTLQQGSLPVDGSFQLGFTSGTTLYTANLSPYASSDEVKSALEQLASIGRVQVSRTTNPDGYSWFVTFSGCRSNSPAICNFGDVNPLLTVATGLTGGQGASVPTVVATEVVKGVPPLQSTLVMDLSGGDPFELTISSLSYGTKYYTRAYFHNAVSFGTRALSMPQFVVTKNLPPGAPVRVQLVSSSATSITLAWSAPTINGGATVSGYELWISEWGSVYRKVYNRPNDAATPTTTLLTSADNVIESGRKYQFKVRAINFCLSEDTSAACYGGFSDPAEYTVRSPVVPKPPASLTRDSTTTINTAAANDGIIVVDWTPPEDNGGSPVTSYQLFMDDGTVAEWTQLALVGAFPHGYTHSVTGLKEGNVYRFYMRAVNAIGPSGQSPILAVVMANVPSAPSAPAVVDVGPTSIQVSWLPPSSCTSTLTGCNGSPLLGYKLWQFPGVTASYTASGSPVKTEVQRIQTFVDPPVSEVQSVTITGASGQFALYVNQIKTSLLNAGTAQAATNTQVKTAIESACNVGSVAVTSSASATGTTWTITFTDWKKPLPMIVVIPDLLTKTVASTDYITSVTRIQGGSSALGGDFTVSFRGFETSHLSVSATTAAEMKRQLENLPSIGVVDVSATAGADNTMMRDITFLTELGDLPLMKVTNGRLIGGNPRITVTTIEDGTPGKVVYDGSNAPDVLAYTSRNLVSDTLYAFVAVAINAAGDGIGGVSTPAIAASSGASSAQTLAYGPALVQGMAGIVYECKASRRAVSTRARSTCTGRLGLRSARSRLRCKQALSKNWWLLTTRVSALCTCPRPT